ncbi:MAG: radical SAM family heme chaperone HemW [Porticoccaceae bacterium]|nr:MAG: radical SAM family heme chaperone HemW [Porticoccaceae bacterium]
MLKLPPLALYVHVPWCVRKCPYCDFNSHQAAGVLPEAEYVRALIADLDCERDRAQGRRFGSVFIGGGTPSLFSAPAIAAVLEAADRRIGFTPDAEITLEANPGTADADNFRGYRAAGVNRLSIGVQSFSDPQLAALGRIHSGGEALRAFDLARAAGFENINLDLMHCLPGQTPAQAVADLEQAIALAPEHLSWYQLTIEPNTLFYRKPPRLPDEAVLEAINTAGATLLDFAGYRQYEVSAHARDGRYSRHNVNYWEFGDYIGIGAGAHGKLTDPDAGCIQRRRKVRHPRDYLARDDDRCAEQVTLGAADLPLEFFLNALRLNAGVPVNYFAERTGQPLTVIAGPWNDLVRQGLAAPLTDRLATTPTGHRFLDTVLAAF